MFKSWLILLLVSHPLFAKESKLVSLGKKLFFDVNLSLNRSQSCATCHNPQWAFIDPRQNKSHQAASIGDDGNSIGQRNAPTVTYAATSPSFYWDKKKKEYFGGVFHDGRASNLIEQAGGPPLNPLEMAMTSKTLVYERLKSDLEYQKLFKDVFGPVGLVSAESSYQQMTEAIAEFEKTSLFSPFDSKYDRYLSGAYELTDLEDLGRSLFFSNNNTNCSQCHLLKSEDEKGETFTNYGYHNIGVPDNLKLNHLNKLAAQDKGLLANPLVNDKGQIGKFKVPTLRNIAVTSPYMHNGVFRELETVILFYDHFNNTKSNFNPETGKVWREGPYPQTINHKKLSAKPLNQHKIKALVAFLKLLTDKRYEHLL